MSMKFPLYHYEEKEYFSVSTIALVEICLIQSCIIGPYNLSLVMRKPDFCICDNKDADQLRGYREADQRLCFRYTDSTVSLLPKKRNFKPLAICVVAQPGLCGTWSETPKTGFLRTRLICDFLILVHEPDNFLLPVTESKSNNTFL